MFERTDSHQLENTALGSFDGTTYQYVETDHLGTPRAVVNSNPTKNVIIWRWDLNNTVFGEHAPNANPDGDSLSYTLNLRYPGQYADAESGMNYNYRRDYEPATGRYIESDPVGLKGGSNTYRYVDADPLTGIDPRGLWKAYGFWCGPNWTGGKNEEFSPEHVYKRPEDRLDTACMNHDMCFYTCRAGYPCDLIGRQKCFKKCDSILSAEAYAVGGFSGNSIGFTMNHASHDGEKADPNCKFCEPTGK